MYIILLIILTLATIYSFIFVDFYKTTRIRWILRKMVDDVPADNKWHHIVWTMKGVTYAQWVRKKPKEEVVVNKYLDGKSQTPDRN